MNNQQTTEILKKQLEQIEKIINRYHDISSISMIDRDLLLEKLRSVYDALLSIETIETKHVISSKKEEDVQLEDIQLTVNESQIGNSVSVESNDIVEFELEEKDNSSSSHVNLNTEKEVEEDTEVIKKEKKIIADIYSKNDPLINEYIAARIKQKDLSTVLQNRPIKNLTDAIDINDKFYFTRELFHNDHQLFRKTIEVLNNLPSFNEAMKYLNQQFMWNFESETVQRFLEILRRRYISDKE